MKLKQRIGKRIQEIRILKGLKQSELSELVGIATKTQSCIETGRNLPSAELLEKYAKVFEIDEAELLNIEHIKTKEQLLIEIKNMLSKISDNDIVIIYKILKGFVS